MVTEHKKWLKDAINYLKSLKVYHMFEHVFEVLLIFECCFGVLEPVQRDFRLMLILLENIQMSMKNNFLYKYYI